MQVATQVFPFLEIPNWVVRLVIVVIVIGFLIALVIAWAFQATPQGIKRTEIADAMPEAAGPAPEQPARHAFSALRFVRLPTLGGICRYFPPTAQV